MTTTYAWPTTRTAPAASSRRAATRRSSPPRSRAASIARGARGWRAPRSSMRLRPPRRAPPTVPRMGVLDAVADPVRLRIVRHLADGGSATLAELADVAGVHLNTIRGHVAALERADVLRSAQKAASGPGRPAVEYRLVEGWGLSSTDFFELAGLLASALVRTRPDDAALRATGAEWG